MNIVHRTDSTVEELKPSVDSREYAPSWMAWMIWCIAAVFYLTGFYHRVSPAVMTDELMRAFQIGAGSLGNLSAFYFYAYVLMQIPTGILIDVWGPRRLLIGGSVMAAVGAALFGSSTIFWVACVGRAIIGGATAVGWVALLKLTTHWFPSRKFAMLTGLGLLFGNVGALVAQVPLRIGIQHFGWRPVVFVTAAAIAVIALLAFFLVKDDPIEKGFRSYAPAEVNRGHMTLWQLVAGFKSIFGYRNTWFIFLSQGALVGSMLAFTGLWGSPYLRARFGLTPTHAAAVCSIMIACWAAASPVCGALSDRIGRRKPIYVGGTVVALVGWSVMLFLPGLALWGFVAVAVFTCAATGAVVIGFAFSKESVPVQFLGTISGTTNIGNMIGPTLLQPGIGWVLDKYWTGAVVKGAHVYSEAAYQRGFLLMIGWLVLACILLSMTRETFANRARNGWRGMSGLEYDLSVPKSKANSSDKASAFQISVREELHKIISSKAFRQMDRLQRFLTYVVEECLAGRGDQLKEYPVGVDVFGKDSSFDPRMDPIVRVQARRLRMRLASYYEEEGQADEIHIDLPKGGYSPTIRRVDLPQQRKSTPLTLVSRNSVAVLPFVDDSAGGDERAFCHGVAQEIIQGLSKLPSLVIASSANGHNADKRAVAMTISGSLRKAGNTLRITTQISDDVRGCYVWTDTIDRKMGDPFALQEEIAQKVVEVLRSELLDVSQGAGLKASRVDNVAAQTLYLQGRYHLSQRTERGLAKAIEFFTEAIQEDPRSAQAYAGLADAHNLSAHYGLSAPVDVWTKAASNASQAVLLDDASSEAHTSLAHVKATQDWDWAGAEQEFRRAIALDSRNATAHHWYAVACLAPLGRLVEAMEQIRLAHAIDPISSIISRDIALLYYYYQRNYDLALEQCDRAIEQNPHFSPVYWTLGLVQEQRGDCEEAIAAFQRAIELSPPSPRILGALGGVYAKNGKKEKAISILAELQNLSLSRYISPFELALIHFNLGRKDEGFVLLTKAFEDRCVELISINLDPRFDVVRSDLRFKALIKRLNLPST